MTDLGYRVHLDAGVVVDDSATFDPCAVDAGASLPRAGWRAARADAPGDPSRLALLHVENLVDLEAWGPRWARFPPARYCRAHWLVARATQRMDEPADVDVRGRSLLARGTWSRGDAAGAFAVDTWWPHGTVVPLAHVVAAPALASARDGAPREAVVRVRRVAARLFDGIDFATASPERVAAGLLDDLLAGTTMEIELVALP